MTKQELIKHYNDLANKYEDDVLNDKIIVSKYIKKAVQRHIELRNKYDYRQDKVDKVFAHYYYLKLGDKPFKLMDWQCWFIKSVYGLYHKDTDFRVVKYILLTVGRKNGKSGYAASLALYHFLKEEKNNNPTIILTATTAKQANILLDETKRIIRSSKAIKKRVNTRAFDITLSNSDGLLMTVANVPEKLDGYGVSFSINDEQAALKDKKLFNVLKSGTFKRDNPLMMQISTSSYNKDFPFYEEVEIGKTLLDGELEDAEDLDNTLYFIFHQDTEDELKLENSHLWVKSNPSIGKILRLDTLIEDFKKSKKYPSEYSEFIIKNLNWYYADTQETWLEDEILKQRFQDIDLQQFKGYNAYMGLDLSATQDLSSLAIVWQHNNKVYTHVDYFYPESEGNRNNIRKNGINIERWIPEYITSSGQKTIDYDQIYDRIMMYKDIFKIKALGYDDWNVTALKNRVEREGRILCNNCPQTTKFFNYPSKMLEKMVYDENVVIQKNPVTRWNFRNVQLYKDGADNQKPDKSKSRDSIDGVIAILNALGQMIEIEKIKAQYI